MNLVPFPRMHYLVSSITPLYAMQDVSLPPRKYVRTYMCFNAHDVLYIMSVLYHTCIRTYVSMHVIHMYIHLCILDEVHKCVPNRVLTYVYVYFSLYTPNSMCSYCRLDQMFTDAFSRDHQLIKADPKSSLYLACALMLRGKVEISDIRRNIDRLHDKFITPLAISHNHLYLYSIQVSVFCMYVYTNI